MAVLVTILVSFASLAWPSEAQSDIIARAASPLHAAVRVVPTIRRDTSGAGGTVSDFVVPYTTSYSEIDALTFGPDGNEWFSVSNTFFGYLSPSNTFTLFAYPPGTHDYYQLISAHGSLWGLSSNFSLDRIDVKTGAVTLFSGDSMNSIAVGPEGDVWFTDPFLQIGHIHPNGAITFVSTAPDVPYTLTFGCDRKPYFLSEPPEPALGNPFIGRLESNGSITHLALHADSPALLNAQCSVLAIGGNPQMHTDPPPPFAPDIAQRFLPDGSSSMTSDVLHPRFYAVGPAVEISNTNVYLLAHKLTPYGSGTVYGGVLQVFFGSQGPFSNPIGNILYGSALGTDNASDAFVGIYPYDGHAHISVYRPAR